MGRDEPNQPVDHTAQLIAELQDRVSSLEESNRANRHIIEALTSRTPAKKGPPEGEPERLGFRATLFRFLLGLLVVSFFAVFDAYMYDDQAFGPLVRVLPLTLLAAGAFGVYAGYKTGTVRDFKWFQWGGLIVGAVAMVVVKYASVKANAPLTMFPLESNRLLKSILKMGVVLVFVWMLFTSGAYIGKLAAFRRRQPGGEEFLKTIASVAGAIVPLLVSVIAALSGGA